MKCKDFHIEVEAGLKDSVLSIKAQDHAADCPPCHEFNQKHVEFREWLTVCQSITAPTDFQFGVQRKIANAAGTHSHSWAWSSLRYIVPSTALAAVLVLAGSYAFNNPNTTGAPGTTTAFSTSQQHEPSVPSDERNSTIAGVNNSQPDNTIASLPKPENEKSAIATNNKPDIKTEKELSGGTLDSQGRRNNDSAVTKVPEPETPTGIHVRPVGASSLSETLKSLSKLGVLAGVDLTVNGLKAGSAAERSGVKVGDVVNSLNGNILTVTRNGQPMQIALK